MRAMALAVGAAAAWASAEAPGSLSAQSAPSLFDTHEVLPLTLAADFGQLVRDRRASPDRPATLTLTGPTGGERRIPAELRTRGEFRLDPSNCAFPPLRLDVDADEARGSVFEGQQELKIVSSCRPGRASYDRLVALEYLAYRAYGVITDRSFRVRPIRMTLVDTGGARAEETRYAFLIEDDEALAARLGATVFDLEEGRNLPASAFDPTSTVMTAIFEYMIGNPDWSEVAGHNVEILDRGGTALAVPYDFDFSGLVDAPYATAPPEYGLDSVRERLYRGWCGSEMTTALVLGRFRETREQVLALFARSEELDEEARRRATRYLEGFYDAIDTDERARRRFLRDCREVGA